MILVAVQNWTLQHVLAKWYSSHLVCALYITCQIRHASDIRNYTLQAAWLQFEVYLDANQTSGKSLWTMHSNLL